MLNLDRDYLIDSLDDVDVVLEEFSCNEHDQHWLAYCALGGHEQCDLPGSTQRLPELYSAAA